MQSYRRMVRIADVYQAYRGTVVRWKDEKENSKGKREQEIADIKCDLKHHAPGRYCNGTRFGSETDWPGNN